MFYVYLTTKDSEGGLRAEGFIFQYCTTEKGYREGKCKDVTPEGIFKVPAPPVEAPRDKKWNQYLLIHGESLSHVRHS